MLIEHPILVFTAMLEEWKKTYEEKGPAYIAGRLGCDSFIAILESATTAKIAGEARNMAKKINPVVDAGKTRSSVEHKTEDVANLAKQVEKSSKISRETTDAVKHVMKPETPVDSSNIQKDFKTYAGKVKDVKSVSDNYFSLRDLISPEEIARYDKYWNKVAEEKLTFIGNQKAFEIIKTQGRNSAGPCLSTVYDPELNKFYFGQNFRSGKRSGRIEYENWLEKDADPIIKERTQKYQHDIDNGLVEVENPYHDDRLAAHSEIRALNQALEERRKRGCIVTEPTIKEMYVYNIDLRELYKSNNIVPKPRCENCKRLTEGINTVLHN